MLRLVNSAYLEQNTSKAQVTGHKGVNPTSQSEQNA